MIILCWELQLVTLIVFWGAYIMVYKLLRVAELSCGYLKGHLYVRTLTALVACWCFLTYGTNSLATLRATSLFVLMHSAVVL